MAAASDDAAVAAYLAALPGWQREVARRIDAIVAREVPGVRRAIKWRVPNYGTEANGWFAALAGFKAHVKVNFFRGAELTPPPPEGTGELMRSLDLREGDKLDERQLAKWFRQAAAMPGMGAKKR
ncbi:MAG: hypothetical protein QOD77_664 [Thermoplasmata archaeon]|jgi:hypothetical protein|nr:hypothetical protein [Thermoplasmata archaeon]